MSIDNDYQYLLKFRNTYKKLDQITWSIRSSEKRFLLGNSENERNLLAIYRAMRSDVEDVLEDLNKIEGKTKEAK